MDTMLSAREAAKAAALAAYPIYGATVPTGQYGITTTGEVAPVLSTLRDGTDLMAVWTEFSEVLGIWNKRPAQAHGSTEFPHGQRRRSGAAEHHARAVRASHRDWCSASRWYTR